MRFRQQMGGAEVFAVLIERLPSRREAELLAAALREQGFLDSVVLDGEPGPSVRVGEPLVLRGIAANWPMVRAGLESQAAATTYLRRFYKDTAVVVMSGEPGIGGQLSHER